LNYLAKSSEFQIKKMIRNIRLNGWRRAWAEASGINHLSRNYITLPRQIGKMRTHHRVGMIGCGSQAYSAIAFYLRQEFGNIIAACMDKDINRAASLAMKYKVPLFTANADDVLESPNVELIYIASNPASHTEYAVRALEYGKDVYIESPHVVSIDQLHRLHKAMLSSEGKVFLGFNRPFSRFGKIISQRLNENSGQAVLNWFVSCDMERKSAAKTPDKESRELENFCHWSDHVLQLAGSPKFPVTIIPARYEQSGSDFAVSLVFADSTVVSMTFASRGDQSWGTHESFRGRKGNLLIAMEDFQKLIIESDGVTKVYRNFRRESGCKGVVINAYRNTHYNEAYYRAEEVSHILNTAWLFLNIKEALQKNSQLIIRSYEEEFANIYSANTQKEAAGMAFENAIK
jgi:predicted dehydrogenase